ncbi:MAG: UvrB/UvrC motif-containing protein, partial [bacterium]|nr:UvrB/UvrC motif-containing protein [bacterium]
MIENGLKTKITSLPRNPGIYIYKDTKGDVLYVGKAKNLCSRVRSYFTKSADLGPLKEKLITLIADLETISTDTELEALVLEATLIHKHQPPYNVLLRDDKYYLFIKITKEEPPRIFPVRKITRDGSRYFGPYSSAFSVRATLRLLQRIFPFKGEKSSAHDIIFPHTLFPQSSHPLQLPLGQGESVTNVINFLKGNRREIIKTLEQGIQDASKNQEFERAALFRDQLQAVQRLEGSQKVYLPRKESFDVISIAESGYQ